MPPAITNRKLATVAPSWAPFRGFSLLFDNPGDSYIPLAGRLSRVNSQVFRETDLALYKVLANSLDAVGRDRLIEKYLFCPLPPESYHVTVWDGLNDGNASHLPENLRLHLDRFFDALPVSFSADAVFTNAANRSPLVTEGGRGIRFEFRNLRKFANVALVAELAPTDLHSEETLRRIIDGRKQLCIAYKEEFDIDLSSDYRPHVTLGYFANNEIAELCTPELQSWTDLTRQSCAGATILFSSIDVYGFTDMAAFFKRA